MRESLAAEQFAFVQHVAPIHTDNNHLCLLHLQGRHCTLKSGGQVREPAHPGQSFCWCQSSSFRPELLQKLLRGQHMTPLSEPPTA